MLIPYSRFQRSCGWLFGKIEKIPQALSWPEVFGILDGCEEPLTVTPQGLWTILGRGLGNTAQKWTTPDEKRPHPGKTLMTESAHVDGNWPSGGGSESFQTVIGKMLRWPS